MKPQLMVRYSGCIHCGKCQSACTNLTEACRTCGKCVQFCPLGLRQISGYEITADQLEQKIRKNSDYYNSLGGGVTFSGGEPLMQGPFLVNMLERLSDLHTAVETCAFAPAELFSQVVNLLSLVIIDIKIVDSTQHKQYTGVDNKLILKNLKYLCEGEKPFILRTPLIPGVTDTLENLTAIARLIKDAKSLQRVELLPYHKTAGAKYAMLGRIYSPGFNEDTPLFNPQKIFEEYKIRSLVL